MYIKRKFGLQKKPKKPFTYFGCHECSVEMSQDDISVETIISVPPKFALHNCELPLQPNRCNSNKKSIEVVVAQCLDGIN